MSSHSTESAGGAQPRRRIIDTDELALELASDAVDTLSDRQASDIVLLDVRTVSSVADFFVVCSGETERQLRALQESVEKVFLDRGVKALHREGTPDSGWVLLDFGAVIVHLFGEEQRGFYQVDRLWDRANPILRIQ